MKLFTARLVLVRGDPEVSAFETWIQDPEVVRYSELRHGVDKPIVEGDNRPSERWTVYLGDEEIGRLGVTFDKPNNTADLSILMGEKKHWGKGYGTEAWTAVMDHLLKSQRKVTAGTMAVNIGMLKIFKKSGMDWDGVRQWQFLWEGKEVDCVLACKFA